MTIHYQGHGVTLHHGDCLDVLRTLPDASVDSVVNVPLARRMPTDNQIAELARLVHERDRLRAEVGA